MVAQYKEELGGFVIDLKPVFDLAGANSVNGQYDFFIPLDAQGMFDKWIDGKKPAASTSAAAPLNSAASIDKIIGGIAGMFDQNGKFTFNFGSIMNLISPVIDVFQSLGAIADDADFIEIDEITDGSSVVVHLAALMENLISDNGLIGGLTSKLVEFKLYNGTDSDKDTYTLAQILAGDDVLRHIVTLINSLMYEKKGEAYMAETTYEQFIAAGNGIAVTDIYGWAAKLGISLSEDQADLYEAIGDVEVSASYRDGIAFELSLAGMTLGIEADIAGYVAPESNMSLPEEKNSVETVEVTKEDGTKVTEPKFSTYTGNDAGRLLFNTLKELANIALLKDSKFEQKIESGIVWQPVVEDPAA